MLLLIEAGFTVYFFFHHEPDPRIMADCYDGAEWVNDYYKEFNESSVTGWQPYVYWRRNSCDGKYITVSKDGIRKTVNISENTTGEPKIRIFVFGGSAVWGTGVRNEFTIPSLISSELFKAGIHTEVVNFGESGYVSTQEIFALIHEIQKGNMPDIVVFYDGVNDVFSAYQQGEAGIPQNENNRVKEYNALTSKKKALKVLFDSLRSLSTLRFIRELTDQTITPIPYTPDEKLRIVSDAIDVYQKNLKILDRLSDEMGFKALYFWQPTIFGKKFHTPYEKLEAENYGYLKEVFEEAAQKVGEMPGGTQPNVYNLSEIFHDEQKPVFMDYCHVSEYGNTVVAKEISRKIVELIRR